jgi:tetratricopeptide (TPR) repeat protein
MSRNTPAVTWLACAVLSGCSLAFAKSTLTTDEAIALIAQGTKLESQKKYAEAAAVYTQVVDARPFDGTPYALRGWVFHLQGKPAEALADLEMAVAFAPDDSGALNRRGLVRQGMEDFKGAAEDFASVAKREPKDSRSRYNLAFCLMRTGRLKEALGPIGEAVTLDPAKAEYYSLRGAVYDKLGDKPNALADCEQGLSLAKDEKLIAILQKAKQRLTATGDQEGRSANSLLPNGRPKREVTPARVASPGAAKAEEKEKAPTATGDDITPDAVSLAAIDSAGAVPPTGVVPKAKAIDAAKLTADIGRFRALAAIQPAGAWKTYFTAGAFERLPEVQRAFFGSVPPEIGWSYFFHSAIYVVCPYDNDVAVAFFYHPWSDTGLVTLWQQINGRSLLIRADAVPGDMLRNPSGQKIALSPAWLRQVDEMSPALTLPIAAGETLRAFIAMFPAEAARSERPFRNATRDQFGAALENASLMTTFGAVASVRMAKCLDGLQRYADDRTLTPYRGMTDRFLAQFSRGDFSTLAGSATETLPETLTLLQRLQSRLAGYSVVAFVASPRACQIFLSHPAEPRNVLSFWYETQGDRTALRRVDFIDHELGVLLGDKLRSLVDTALAQDAATTTPNK